MPNNSLTISAVDTVNRTVTVTSSPYISNNTAYLFSDHDSTWDIAPQNYDYWPATTQLDINRLHNLIIANQNELGKQKIFLSNISSPESFPNSTMTSLEKEIHDINTMGYRE